MLRLASAPSYTILSSGMDPADAGKVTTALDEQGIGYELRANGTTVAVEKAQVGAARIALSSAGVSAGSGSQAGFELFDEQKLGASDFQQKVTYQRALEGEIARTVEQVDGVSGAQVQLVLPEDSLFADEETAATAAVMLSGDSGGARVGRRARHRAAHRLLGQGPQDRERDDHRRLRASCSGRRTTASAAAPPAAASRPRRRATSASSRRASTRCSPRRSGRARPASRSRPTSTSTRPRASSRSRSTARPCPRQADDRDGEAQGRRRRGRLRRGGHGGQHPAPTRPARRGGGAGSNYKRKSETRRRTSSPRRSTKTDVAPGAVNNLQVALVVDKSVPAADFAAIQNAIKGAAGIDEERGDVFQASQLAFAKAPAAPKAGPVPVGDARPAEVGRPRPGHAAVHVLHEPPPQAPRGRGARLPELADRDRAARVARRARGAVGARAPSARR